MPIFDYKCPKCDHVFERIVSTNDPEPEPCPKCNEPSPRIFTVGSIKFLFNYMEP